MAERDAGRCGHEGCKCAIGAGEPYCSDYCAGAGANASLVDTQVQASQTCNCGHPECEGLSFDDAMRRD